MGCGRGSRASAAAPPSVRPSVRPCCSARGGWAGLGGPEEERGRREGGAGCAAGLGIRAPGVRAPPGPVCACLLPVHLPATVTGRPRRPADPAGLPTALPSRVPLIRVTPEASRGSPGVGRVEPGSPGSAAPARAPCSLLRFPPGRAKAARNLEKPANTHVHTHAHLLPQKPSHW
ncbi:cuticle collagen 2-like isoform X2 [Cavia porcellus]|uniref:cuticle collagen 2-like isoform X2 n=1 Tax=Cavia porcellus TaxID=10141 RepID=UPI002FE257EE